MFFQIFGIVTVGVLAAIGLFIIVCGLRVGLGYSIRFCEKHEKELDSDIE